MPEFNRRQLFRLKIKDLGREVGKIVESPAPDGECDGLDEPSFPRPPGAIPDETDFLETCERCHACAAACPHDAIQQYGPVHGRREGTPFIDPTTAPCHWCEDMPCIEACPSEALNHDPDQSQAPDHPVPPIAKVTLNLDQCLNRQGILCDTCAFRCPSHIKAIRMIQRMPVLDSDACTGCGMCLYHCEAEPSAFALIS